ncbi:MAG TPA: hypothetical protein VE820_02540, partial [Sphingomicrobium sp.]|nr:hypothetical protein [Sphingomicrobium sp.]
MQRATDRPPSSAIAAIDSFGRNAKAARPEQQALARASGVRPRLQACPAARRRMILRRKRERVQIMTAPAAKEQGFETMTIFATSNAGGCCRPDPAATTGPSPRR